ncbi:MAG: AAA family ATPase [Gemmatimonadaceae bacterium]
MSKKPARSIHARVLGDASIVTGVTTIDPMAEIIFAAALYLVLQRKEPISRRTIQALLWPDASDRVAAHRLRQTLLKLRQMGMPIEMSGKGHIGLNGTPVSVDYEEFLATKKFVENGNNDALVMLPAYEPRFSQAYLEWLDSQKAEVNASMTRIMLGIIARHRVKGEWVEVERNATRLLRFQPYNEEATLALAEAYAMRGGKLQAMEILDRYLSEVGNGPTDLRLPATVMRKRIADRMHPRLDEIDSELPLVGRGAEMEQMGRLLQSARRKKGRGCLIWGDAGIGKTRLIAEFSTFARLQGVGVQRVQCRPNDLHRPLSAFVDLVPGLRSMRGAIGCSPETFTYLDRLTKHKPNHTHFNADPNAAEFVYAAIQQSLFDLIDAVSDEACLLLIVEDIHWLDSTSAALLREMVEWSKEHSLLFVFTGRDEPGGGEAQIARGITAIHLTALNPEPAKDVLLGVIRQHGREIDERYADWCVTVAEGNPYFLHELANHWVETGEKRTVPPSLAAVLNERLARLRPSALQLLQTCAVLEQNSTLERIECALKYEPHEMLLAVNELAHAGMLLINSDWRLRGPDRLSPRHEFLSNAALARLTRPASAFLHRRIATILEAEVNDERSAAILWDSAKHWQLCGDTPHAFELARSCATHLMEMGLPKSAADAYEKTLGYCNTVEEKLGILKGLVQAHYGSRSWKDVERAVVQFRKLTDSVAPHENRHDEFELMAIRAAWRHRDSTLPLSHAIRCLEDEQASADHRVEAGGTALMICDQICDHDAMRSIFKTISSVCAANTVDRLLQLRAEMVYHTVCGDLAIGASSAREAVEAQRERGNPSDLFTALCNAAASWRTCGLFDDAEKALREAHSIAHRQNLEVAESTALLYLAHLFLEIGENSKARDLHRILTKRTSKVENETAMWRLLGLSIRIALIDHRYSEARKLTRGRLKQVGADPMPERKVYHLALIVAVELKTGGKELNQALALLEEAHVKARVNGRQAFASYALYHGLVNVGKKARAEVLLKEYLTKYRREPWAPGSHMLAALADDL